MVQRRRRSMMWWDSSWNIYIKLHPSTTYQVVFIPVDFIITPVIRSCSAFLSFAVLQSNHYVNAQKTTLSKTLSGAGSYETKRGTTTEDIHFGDIHFTYFLIAPLKRFSFCSGSSIFRLWLTHSHFGHEKTYKDICMSALKYNSWQLWKEIRSKSQSFILQVNCSC